MDNAYVANIRNLSSLLSQLQDSIARSDMRTAQDVCDQLAHLEQRLRADTALVRGELKILEQRCDVHKKTADRLEACLFEARESYEQSIAVFQRFRNLIRDMQRLRSLTEFPGFLLELKTHLEVDSLELVLRAELCDDFVFQDTRTAPGLELQRAIDALPQGGAGYLGTVRNLPGANFFLGGTFSGKGSCYVHPLDNKYEPGRHIGVLTLFSVDASRYSETKATDFLAHFCELMACAVVTARDHDVLLRQSVIDPLTGVHNRLYLERHAQRLLDFSRRKGFPVSLLFIDLDDFKPVNDTLGHDAGDAILREVAGRISRLVRDYDIFVRLGGDEFVLLCPDADANEARAMGLRLEHEVATIDVAHCTGRLTDLEVSASVGVASQTGVTDLDPLLRQADAAMYASKRQTKKKAEGAI